ncbi:hypothetical protein KAFR_0I02860 [Kazachstania africana CBS 2517]|uniref:Restriction of telomere capping protein 1 n=1 Tax=Kazachstania africana (strain ATCC 22294 / BCRC 22015 / CBS 2517 / CECT 1963 / NBRC 1671 / NRRL Y-8276) TaxID=1071382 RepID=H2B0B5_KAZAF|nr:hypothetical protein KAFR_0I02860 [Kazachstania africana CBS 2517]CCF60065.1 hypothetical protein KAFR_0I02860 [Kazachstania africana CBS 2517]
MNSSPGKNIYYSSNPNSLPQGSHRMSGSLGKNEATQGASFGASNQKKSFRIQHYGKQGSPSPFSEQSTTRPKLFPRHSYAGNNGIGLYENSTRSLASADFSPKSIPIAGDRPAQNNILRHKRRGSKRNISIPSQNPSNTIENDGLIYTLRTNKEVASIDRINDPSLHGLICAGKSHLGYYKFNPEDNTIKLHHDLLNICTKTTKVPTNPLISRRNSRQLKLSTIADVKCGFQNYRNYAAICTNSTTISIFDIVKPPSSSEFNPVVTSFNGHTRSVNGFDFNMIQTNLIISGGQDACVKIWDIRTNTRKDSSRSDINITTSYDSIRDIKWMPGSNILANNSDPSSYGSYGVRSHSGYKFASIHDSGTVLKFDLRQPNQFEKKINAHTGPGLCLNWHPNQDYIATGGRDGKCCLWYVGDKTSIDSGNTYGSNTFTSLSSAAIPPNNPLAFPETTINIGSPITKLKFRPAFEQNVQNSILAISSMGEEAQVSIFSLSRKYIPRHVFETFAPSLGLVWWNDDSIFNIDKDNFINGWDITKAPTLLDNLPKNITTWRDMDGDGLLFVNQEQGSYSATDRHPEESDVPRRESLTGSLENQNSHVTSTLMTGFKKGISQTGLSSFSTERPSLSKHNTSFSSKHFIPSPLGSSYNTSSTPSVKSLIPLNEGLGTERGRSPLLITLDMPHIFNSMRASRLSGYDENTIGKLINNESPVEVFKYLARELEFSIENEKEADDNDSIAGRSSHEENETQIDLMKKFGFSENATWANFMTKKDENELKKTSTSNENSSEVSSFSVERGRSSSNNEHKNDAEYIYKDPPRSISRPPARKSEIEDNDNKLTRNVISKSDPDAVEKSKLSEVFKSKDNDLEPRIEVLLELVRISGHNATVYSTISDTPAFKTWLLIRDSLLWDLKKITEVVEGSSIKDNNANTISAENTDPYIGQSDKRNRTQLPNPSTSSEYSMSEHDYSFGDEHPQPFLSPLKNSQKSPSYESSTINVSPRVRKDTEGSMSIEKLKSSIETYKTIEQLREQHKSHQEDSNTSAIEDDDIARQNGTSPELKDHDKAVPIKPTSIPITKKRELRPSFIDAFLGNISSPSERLEAEFLPSVKLSPSFIHSSPRSRNSIGSLSSNVSHLLFNNRPDTAKSDAGSKNVLFQQLLGLKNKGISNSHENKDYSTTFTTSALPPWSTKRLLRQTYEHSVQTGNILLSITILLLFQNLYEITTIEVVKDSLSEFISLLHRYELFEIATALLKYCPWEDVMGPEGGQSTIQIYCEKCGVLITNEQSKDKFTVGVQGNLESNPFERFGYWYCDSCKKPNSLCVLCEEPMKKMTISLLACGHEGHFDCFKKWFIQEAMDSCPGGCTHPINL